MGDHGMDQKGDHGGESDDEVEAALWMYSKKGVFGRTNPDFVTPPQTAKIRPVDQIDLVPTLALLLGLPIPFNNLGRPIEEAFSGKKGSLWGNLAGAVRMSAAGTKRYQTAYYRARGINESEIETVEGSPHALWGRAEQSLSSGDEEVYKTFSSFQVETLRIFRDLWARFDVPCMFLGIAILAAGVLSLIIYVNSNAEDDAAVDNPELDKARWEAELNNISRGETAKQTDSPSRRTVLAALIGTVVGGLSVPVTAIALGEATLDLAVLDFGLGGAVVGGLLSALYVGLKSPIQISNILPTSIWGWLALVFTVSQSAGFASNSYTIWEDSILLFFVSTFGLVAAISSARIENYAEA